MLSVKDRTCLSDFNQLHDREYAVEMMAYHLRNIQFSLKEIHCDLERLLANFSEFKELSHENK